MRLLALLLLVACGHVGPNPYQGPPVARVSIVVEAPGRADAVDIVAGCNLWRVAGVECHAFPAHGILVLFDEGEPHSCGPEETVGKQHAGENRISLWTDCLPTRELFRQTVAHEIGHVLGVPHLPYPALMSPRMRDGMPYVTESDVAAFIGARGRL